MKCSYRIRGGRVIDPARGIDRVEDVYIRGSRIVAAAEGEAAGVLEEIDASGCLVLPGLIDFHTHINRGHSDFGITPDTMTFPSGVTSAVDAGSTGAANFDGFYRDVVCRSLTTIKSFINVSSVGVITERYPENPDPELYDPDRLEYLFERWPEQILGLKLRMGKLFTGAFGLRPLERTKELARHFKKPMCVHVVYPEVPYSEILRHFEAGDILCHCYQSKGPISILDENGTVCRAAREARERGVIFDAAPAKTNHSLAVIEKALRDGFMPDVIGTDVVAFTMYDRKLFSLLYIMSYFLAMGMPLNALVRAVTATPARLMGMEGQIGTLTPGAMADVSIFKIREKPVTFTDTFGNSVSGDRLFVPQMTIKAGKNVFMQIDFAY